MRSDCFPTSKHSDLNVLAAMTAWWRRSDSMIGKDRSSCIGVSCVSSAAIDFEEL